MIMSDKDFDILENEDFLEEFDEDNLDDEMTPEEEDQNSVYEYIIDETIVALGLDDCEEIDYSLLQNTIFNLLVDCAQGEEPQIATAKLNASLLCMGVTFEDDELKQITDKIETSCAKHILALKMAQQSFENGETSETVLPQIVNFLA